MEPSSNFIKFDDNSTQYKELPGGETCDDYHRRSSKEFKTKLSKLLQRQMKRFDTSGIKSSLDNHRLLNRFKKKTSKEESNSYKDSSSDNDDLDVDDVTQTNDELDARLDTHLSGTQHQHESSIEAQQNFMVDDELGYYHSGNRDNPVDAANDDPNEVASSTAPQNRIAGFSGILNTSNFRRNLQQRLHAPFRFGRDKKRTPYGGYESDSEQSEILDYSDKYYDPEQADTGNDDGKVKQHKSNKDCQRRKHNAHTERVIELQGLRGKGSFGHHGLQLETKGRSRPKNRMDEICHVRSNSDAILHSKFTGDQSPNPIERSSSRCGRSSMEHHLNPGQQAIGDVDLQQHGQHDTEDQRLVSQQKNHKHNTSRHSIDPTCHRTESNSGHGNVGVGVGDDDDDDDDDEYDDDFYDYESSDANHREVRKLVVEANRIRQEKEDKQEKLAKLESEYQKLNEMDNSSSKELKHNYRQQQRYQRQIADYESRLREIRTEKKRAIAGEKKGVLNRFQGVTRFLNKHLHEATSDLTSSQKHSEKPISNASTVPESTLSIERRSTDVGNDLRKSDTVDSFRSDMTVSQTQPRVGVAKHTVEGCDPDHGGDNKCSRNRDDSGWKYDHPVPAPLFRSGSVSPQNSRRTSNQLRLRTHSQPRTHNETPRTRPIASQTISKEGRQAKLHRLESRSPSPSLLITRPHNTTSASRTAGSSPSLLTRTQSASGQQKCAPFEHSQRNQSLSNTQSQVHTPKSRQNDKKTPASHTLRRNRSVSPLCIRPTAVVSSKSNETTPSLSHLNTASYKSVPPAITTQRFKESQSSFNNTLQSTDEGGHRSDRETMAGNPSSFAGYDRNITAIHEENNHHMVDERHLGSNARQMRHQSQSGQEAQQDRFEPYWPLQLGTNVNFSLQGTAPNITDVQPSNMLQDGRLSKKAVTRTREELSNDLRSSHDGIGPHDHRIVKESILPGDTGDQNFGSADDSMHVDSTNSNAYGRQASMYNGTEQENLHRQLPFRHSVRSHDFNDTVDTDDTNAQSDAEDEFNYGNLLTDEEQKLSHDSDRSAVSPFSKAGLTAPIPSKAARRGFLGTESLSRSAWRIFNRSDNKDASSGTPTRAKPLLSQTRQDGKTALRRLAHTTKVIRCLSIYVFVRL